MPVLFTLTIAEVVEGFVVLCLPHRVIVPSYLQIIGVAEYVT